MVTSLESMKVIGLTGGVGMGKSTAARFMEELGCPVVDTDQLARDVVEPGEPAVHEIAEAFGNDMIGADGRLKRDALARCVFGDESKRRQLEAILHPRIRERWQARVDAWREEGKSDGVVVIPLLFETGARELFDVVVCVACSGDVQRERLEKRGWDETQIRQRIQAQWPIYRKMDRSDHIIWTDGSLAVHEEQIRLMMANPRA